MDTQGQKKFFFVKNNFDITSLDTIANLESTFQVSADSFASLVSSVSIGIEIEVKFKYYFPEIHNKYFSNFKEYLALEYADKSKIKFEISEVEKPLQEQLFKTVECGIPHGLDRYWEFAFKPAYDISLICKQVDILNKLNLIPEGNHSLHINLGDTKLTPRMYWVLMTLELLYCSKQRIASGFSNNFTYMSASWAKKGDGGILAKNCTDLQDSECGVELRTLQFNGDSNNLYNILKTLCFLLNGGDEIISFLKKESKEVGLPNSNFGKPHTNPDVWNKYVDNFEHLSNLIKNKYDNKSCNS